MINKFIKSRIPDAKKLVKDLSKSYDYVSILGSHTKIKQIMVTKDSNSMNDVDTECGFVIKAYKNGHYSEYSCDDIRGLKASEVLKSIKLESKYFASIPMLTEEKHEESFIREDKDNLSDKEIFNRLVKIKDDMLSRDERIINGGCMYMKREISKIFVSNNKCLDQKYDWVNAGLQAVVRDGNNIKSDYEMEGEVDTSLALKKLEKDIDKAVDISIKLLNAKPIKPGTYDIITDQSITGLIAHEAFGHGVEMDMFVKKRAKAVNFVGKRVASDLVNMYDGASAAISSASYFFDDDGVEASKTNIIKNGILQTGISDSLSANELGTKPTGNGRRESYKHKVYTRMTNTYFAKGKDKFDDMVKSIKHGYYLCQTSNGMEDPKNWQIQCTACYGLEIKDGKFTGEIVAPVVISGYVVDLLKSISMVSDDFKVIGAGMCGKGHKEWVHVSDGGPNIKARAKLS